MLVKTRKMDGYIGDNERKKLWDELSRGLEDSRLVVVHLTKRNEGFGFNIRGGVDHPHVGSDPGIFITTVKADSVAGRDGRLEPGDRILAMNDVRLDGVTHDVAVNEFRKADETVSLLVEKNAEAQLLSQQIPNSPGSTWVDGPDPLDEHGPDPLDEHGPDPLDERPPQNKLSGLFRQFYESELGALSIGLAVGGLAVFIALRIYKGSKS